MRGYVSKWRGANLRIGIVSTERTTQTELIAAMDRDRLPWRLQSPVIAAVRDGDWNFVEKAIVTLRRCRDHATADYLRFLLAQNLGKENGDRGDLPKGA